MNAAEFNTEISKTLNRTMIEGVQAGKLGIDNIIGILELQKSELLRYVQDQSRLAALKAQQPPIVLPGDRRFKPPPNGAK